MFDIYDADQKPDEWGFDPGLVAPEWQQCWDSLQLAVPVWGDAVQSYDLVNDQVGVPNSAVSAATTKRGSAFQVNEIAEYIRWNKDLNVTRDLTFGIIFRVSGSKFIDGGSVIGGQTNLDGLNHGARGSVADVDWSLLYTGSILRGRLTIAGGSNVVDITQSVSVGDHVSLFLVRRGDTGKIFVRVNNGPILMGTTTGLGSADLDRDHVTKFHVGAGAGSGVVATHDTNMQVEAVYVSNIGWSDSQVIDLINDPFGPFRMVDEVTLFVPAPEAPDNIEIAPMLSPTPRWDRRVTIY